MKLSLQHVACTFFALVSTACASQFGSSWSKPGLVADGPLTTAFVCLDLPAKQLPAAHEAVATWDHVIHQWKHLVAVDTNVDDGCTYWVHEVVEPFSVRPEAFAWTSVIGGRDISMRRGAYEIDTRGILMHELGHAMGAQHVNGTLMNPTWYPGGFACPDVITVVQVAAWNQVNLEYLTWCKR